MFFELKYKPGVLKGGKDLVHDCGVSRSIEYFLEPLIVLGLFGKKPLSIILKGSRAHSFIFKSSSAYCFLFRFKYFIMVKSAETAFLFFFNGEKAVFMSAGQQFQCYFQKQVCFKSF